MRKSPKYRCNNTGKSLFENDKTFESLSNQGNSLEFIPEIVDFKMFRTVLEY